MGLRSGWVTLWDSHDTSVILLWYISVKQREKSHSGICLHVRRLCPNGGSKMILWYFPGKNHSYDDHLAYTLTSVKNGKNVVVEWWVSRFLSLHLQAKRKNTGCWEIGWDYTHINLMQVMLPEGIDITYNKAPTSCGRAWNRGFFFSTHFQRHSVRK